ncbi:hypothetical protein ACHAPU_008945 [Fusarium lateritium]
MAGVVENALLQLKPGYDAQELHAVLKKSQQIQAQWIREHQPKLLEGKPYDHTTDFWISEHESPSLFLTAPWESADAHEEWIKSQENTLLMQELVDFIDQGKDAVVLYHICPAGKNEFRGDLLVKWPVKVWNITVKPEEKEILEKEYRLIETNSSTEPGQRIWAGWKIEKGEAEELTIIASPGCEDAIESGIIGRLEEDRVARFEHKPIFH